MYVHVYIYMHIYMHIHTHTHTYIYTVALTRPQCRLIWWNGFLSCIETATHVPAFVLPAIDYCCSLLYGSTHDVTSHLHRIQYYAARIILRTPKSDNIIIHLQSISYWLAVK